MHTPTLNAVTAALLAAACTIGFASGTSHIQDTKAQDVLAAARKAIGAGTLDGLRTLSVEGTLKRNVNERQMAAEVELLLALPDKYVRSERGAGPVGAGFAFGFNGGRPIRPANSTMGGGGMMMIRIGPGGPPPAEPLSPEAQQRADEELLRTQRAEISRLMLGWFAAAHPSLAAQYSYAGDAVAPDGKAHVIDVRAEDAFAARLFIDQQTNLPLMVTYQGVAPRIVSVSRGRGPRPAPLPDPQGPRPLAEISVFFEDWREAGGLTFPHVMRRATDGTTNEEWTVSRVRVNPQIDPRKFDGN